MRCSSLQDLIFLLGEAIVDGDEQMLDRLERDCRDWLQSERECNQQVALIQGIRELMAGQ